MTKTKDDDFFKMKNDQGKTDWSLLPWRAIESAARIMTIAIAPKEQGGKGYGLASWQDVPEGFFRYWAAMVRHIIRRFVYGEIIDQDSGEPHMGHVICNAAFVFEKDRQLEEDGNIDINFYERKQKKDDWYEKAMKDLSRIPDDVFTEEKQPTQIQLLHDRDYTEMFKQCDDTYEDAIRRTCELAKPNNKQLICIKCSTTLAEHLNNQELYPGCMHLWKLK